MMGGALLTMSDNGRAQVWNTATGRAHRQIRHFGGISASTIDSEAG
jgi:hypothetical protein